MIRKFAIIIITTCALTLNVQASSDGDLILKKNDPTEIKECWEGFNRASFALNQGLDKVIFKPIASIYRTLPIPIKAIPTVAEVVQLLPVAKEIMAQMRIQAGKKMLG